MQSSIEFGSKTIAYQVEYTNRKSLGITVTPEMAVLVKAPFGADEDKVKELIRKRAPWILKQQSFFLSFHPRNLPRKYVSGETHLYLGRQYRLKILEGEKNEVRYQGKYIVVTTKDKGKVKELVTQWYREHAKKKFADIARPLIEQFKKYGVEPSAIHVQEMPTRWGSCTPKGKIILNPELIKAPKGCIEYVITHELCHLVHPNHTQKFFDLQSKEKPDWEKWKARLERLLA